MGFFESIFLSYPVAKVMFPVSGLLMTQVMYYLPLPTCLWTTSQPLHETRPSSSKQTPP